MARISAGRRIVLALLVGLASTAVAAGAATPVRIDLIGEVTESDFFTVVPGDPVAFWLHVDAATADENPASGEFAATNPGSFAFQLKDLAIGTGDILAISADVGTGAWNGALLDSNPAAPAEIAIVLHGLGLTPDQILPNHASFVSGTGSFDIVGGPWAFATIEVAILSVEIVPIEVPVPAFGFAARSGLALLLLLLGTTRAGHPRRRTLPQRGR
jgi:hypothetical protein